MKKVLIGLLVTLKFRFLAAHGFAFGLGLLVSRFCGHFRGLVGFRRSQGESAEGNCKRQGGTECGNALHDMLLINRLPGNAPSHSRACKELFLAKI